MSSLPKYPENTATVVPVSHDLGQSGGAPVGGVDGHHVHHVHHQAIQDIPRPSSSSSLIIPGNLGTSDAAVSPALIGTTGTPPTPAPAATHGDGRPPSSSVSVFTATTPAKEQSSNKTARSLPVRHRSGGGPSLLTQGLAKARGILALKDHTQSQSQSQSQLQPQLQPDSNLPIPTTSIPSTISLLHTHQEELSVTSNNDSNAAVHQNDDDAMALTSIPVAMATSTTTATTLATDMRTLAIDATSIRPRYDFRDLENSDSLARSHRELLNSGRGRGTSLERTDKERRLHEQHLDLFSNAYTHNPGDTALPCAPLSDDSNSSDQDINAESRARYRLWRGDHLPEKIWSIGSEGSGESQNGQVEKSITEVLTGVEHNPRSRKTSHSLRFFKEGLPEDKAKRKESRPRSHSKETLHVHPEECSPCGTAATSGRTSPSIIPPPRLADEPRAGMSRVRSFPLETPLVESPQTDYFNASWQTRHTPPHSPRIVPVEKMGAITGSRGSCEPDGSDENPKEGVANGEELVVDGGDDSGEEKVSSALFVPHQAADNDEVRDPATPTSAHHPHALVAKSRSHSRVDDYHPWLVRTDELEPDVQTNEQEVISQPVFVLDQSRTSIYEKDDVVVEEEHETVRPSLQIVSRPQSQIFDDSVDQTAAKQPLDAIELIPYKHQVGGHTTIWRFSRRAVCKKLNNRENEFYETVERYHRDLLLFLPRYIGVLNVTYQKQPRRKSVIKLEQGVTSTHKNGNGATAAANGAVRQDGTGGDSTDRHARAGTSQESHRVISQSLQSTQIQVPTVTFVDNQHILPRHLLPRHLLQSTSTSSSSLLKSLCTVGHTMQSSDIAEGSTHINSGKEWQASSTHVPSSHPDTHSKLEGHQAQSWGATTVNKRLRNLVFNDAFLRQPVPVEKHKKGHQRPLPRKKLPNGLRLANSDPTIMNTSIKDGEPGEFRVPPSPLKSPLPALDVEEIQNSVDLEVEDVTGTSAPEPEIMMENLGRKKRRYSGTGLRRKPADVSEDRGNLKYFQEPDDTDSRNIPTRSTSKDKPQLGGLPLVVSRQATPARRVVDSQAAPWKIPSTLPSVPPPFSSPAEFKRISRPPNPKEAQTQKNSRVEYFLLIEDLTAGMKKPCVMDLKMGTRQYGIEATPKKQQSQKRKCAATTSRSLGVRVCGLQVWDVKSQSYIFRDKYYGRHIKAGDEFQQAVTRFLYDGVDLHSILRHIPTVLQKLEQLEVIVSRLCSYRFYAASLLIYYDGDTSVDEHEANMDDSTTDFATDNEETRSRKKSRNRTIDFKIADFANCVIAADSVKDKPCPPRFPNGPDRGFVKGLQNLRQYFLKIQRDARIQLGLPPYGVAGQPYSMDVIEDDEGELSD